MTPFDQPLQQGEYIPQTPQLPVRAIAQSANQLNQQVEALRSIPNRVGEQIAETAVAPQDRETFNEIFQQRVGQLESMTDDIEGLIDDPNAVTDLAGRITQDLQPFMQTQEAYNTAIEDLEDTQMSEDTRDVAKQLISSTIRTRVDERGNLVPTTQSISYGDEPVDMVSKMQDSVKDIAEQYMGSSIGELGSDLGIMEVISRSGVPDQVLKNRLHTSIQGDAEFQNWIRNRSLNYTMQNSDLSFDNPEDRQRARQIAEEDLQNIVDGYVDSTIDKTTMRMRNIPDGASSSDENAGQYNLTQGSTISIDGTQTLPEGSDQLRELKNDATERKEDTFKNYINNNMENLSDSLEQNPNLLHDMLSALDRAERMRGQERASIVERRPEYRERLDRTGANPQSLGKVDYLVATNTLGLTETDIQELYVARDRANNEYQAEMSNFGTQLYNITDDIDDKLMLISSNSDNIANNVVEDVYPHIHNQVVDMEDSGWNKFNEMSSEDRRNNTRALINNAQNVQVTGDGSSLVLRMKQNDDVRGAQFQGGEPIFIPLKTGNGVQVFSPELLESIVGDDERGETIMSNYRWNNLGITIDREEYTTINNEQLGLNGRIRRNGGRNQQTTYSVQVPTGENTYQEYSEKDRVEELVQQISEDSNVSQMEALGQALEQTVGQNRAKEIIRLAQVRGNEAALSHLERLPYQFNNRGQALNFLQMKTHNQ